MRQVAKSTRTRDNERKIRRETQSDEPDDDENETTEREHLSGEEKEVVEAELRARDVSLLVRFRDLREEHGAIVRAYGGHLLEHVVVLRELRPTDDEVAETDREEEESGDHPSATGERADGELDLRHARILRPDRAASIAVPA
jgi:hypothetical protein